MSQHYFYTQSNVAEDVTVLMGWDRPLQSFFCVVLSNDDDDEEEILYSNLYDENAAMQHVDLPYFTHLLVARFGVNVPEDMVQGIRADAIGNVGNCVTHYGDTGVNN